MCREPNLLMSYAQVDLILYPWAEEHRLHVFTEHKDESVRATIVVDDSGDSYGLGVGEPKRDGSIEVVVYKKTASKKTLLGRKIEPRVFTCCVERLKQSLDEAYSVVESWIQSNGHTRTPV